MMLQNDQFFDLWSAHEAPTYQGFPPFSICFKCQTTVERSTFISQATSHVIVRGSSLMIAVIGCCQLSMAGHCTPHFQGSHLLCKTSFLKKILYYLFIFGFAGSLLLLRLFSSCGEWGLVFVTVRRLLTVVVLMLRRTSSRASGLQQLWFPGSRAQAQQLCCTGLTALQHVASSWTRDLTHVSRIGRRILYHRATREALQIFLNNHCTICSLAVPGPNALLMLQVVSAAL